MRVVRTAVKNKPSKAGSRASLARSHVSRSNLSNISCSAMPGIYLRPSQKNSCIRTRTGHRVRFRPASAGPTGQSNPLSARESTMSVVEAARGTRKQDPSLATEIALLVLLSFIWGGSFTLIKIAVETIPPATVVATRVAVAAVLLILFIGWRGLDLPKDAKAWRGFFVQGLLQSALPFTLISWGEERIASGLAGVLNATPPIFAVLISLAARNEPVGW